MGTHNNSLLSAKAPAPKGQQCLQLGIPGKDKRSARIDPARVLGLISLTKKQGDLQG